MSGLFADLRAQLTRSDKEASGTAVRSVVHGVIIGGLLGLSFAGGYLLRDYDLVATRQSTSFTLLHEAEDLLNQHYLYELPDESVKVHGAVRGFVASLNDPYTYFVEPQAAEIDSTNLAGSFGGIGAEIGRNDQGEFVIVRVYRDNPAALAGILDGDVILAVDGAPVDALVDGSDALIAALRGEIGDPVVLELRRDTETLTVEVVRGEVLIPSAFWNTVPGWPSVGYIQLTRFTDRTPAEVRMAITELKELQIEVLVLDLRGNGGGLVDSSVEIADEFLDGGTVLIERSEDAQERVYEAAPGGSATSIPLVVLIDAGSASASEILAGALQDRERAVLIGRKSFGKGSVQLIFELSDGSALHITNSEWFTPDRSPIQGAGLEPDIATEVAEGYDSDMEAALEYLTQIFGIEPQPADEAMPTDPLTFVII